MKSNRGTTTLKCRSRRGNKMRDYDRLAPDLRAWVANAVLPWRAGSVERAFAKALARTGDRAHALEELDRLQARRVAKDVVRIWGNGHPLSGLSEPTAHHLGKDQLPPAPLR